MTVNIKTTWHKASYKCFLTDLLPHLLAERLPLLSYSFEESSRYTCTVSVTVGSNSNPASVTYELPLPDAEGLFKIDDENKVVIPIATTQTLNQAEIKCVGEQLYDYIVERLGTAATDLPWDTALVSAWLPLETWIGEFLHGVGDRFITAQSIDNTNWLAMQTHLRRLIIPDLNDVIAPGQIGYVCPFETPEGYNVGHVLTIAMGAEIRDGRMAIIDDQPQAALGLSASMVPFLEHNDPNRLLMGANMMRQWIPQLAIEPALVQTGNEPDELLSPEFWIGRNLLTAFISWGNGTYEDGIVISESCAQRFDTPYGLCVGDKLSNRHGTKGLVSQILPDDEMPHLPDGKTVDIVYNFVKQHRRLNMGQIREAVLGRIAYNSGESMIIPPFEAPSSEELHVLLQKAGLPQSGMEILTMGKSGQALKQPSTVGYVYWGRLFHLAKNKLMTFVNAEAQLGQRIGEMETFMLRDLGAYANIREFLGIKSVRHPEAATLASRLAEGPVAQASPPTPLFMDLTNRLHLAGIHAALEDERLSFSWLPSMGTGIKLARPVPHPWLPSRVLKDIQINAVQGLERHYPELVPHISSIVEANDRLARMLAEHTPERLIDVAADQLHARIKTLFDTLLTSVHLRLGERELFSGRAVLIPASDLTLDQLGIPDEMAWSLFAPIVIRLLGGDTNAVKAHDETATNTLDAVMSSSWVILNRAPTFEPTAILAFHPVRVNGNALHLHPLVCKWLNADFDGDQSAIFLPITEKAQREAGEKLSVAAHLTRDPGLLASLVPNLDMLWGLAYLSVKPEGLAEISRVIGEKVSAPAGFVTISTLTGAVTKVFTRDGVAVTLDVLDQLMRLGFAGVKQSGASASPFLGENLQLPPLPSSHEADLWSMHREMVIEAVSTGSDLCAPEFGPQLLMQKAEERAFAYLPRLISGFGPVHDASRSEVIIRSSYVEGLTPEEMYASVAGARRGIKSLQNEWERMGTTFRERNISRSLHVIPRALRAAHPGLVFARAALQNEIDPLTDVESRLLVGLPIM